MSFAASKWYLAESVSGGVQLSDATPIMYLQGDMVTGGWRKGKWEGKREKEREGDMVTEEERDGDMVREGGRKWLLDYTTLRPSQILLYCMIKYVHTIFQRSHHRHEGGQ